MLEAIAAFFGAIIPALIKLWRGMPPPPIVAVAKEAGAAEAELSIEETHDAEVQKASDAVVAVRDAISTPDGLREYEQSDPNNSDNAPAGGT